MKTLVSCISLVFLSGCLSRQNTIFSPNVYEEDEYYWDCVEYQTQQCFEGE